MNRNDAPEEGMYDDSAYRPSPKTMPAYTDVPTCPACGAKACVDAGSFPGDIVTDRDLLCAACGHRSVGTLEQLEQARRAEKAWRERTDDRRGPWMRVLRTRAKKPTPQVGLFTKEKTG